MKPLILLREAWASTRTRLVPALMIVILCGSMCATTLLTVGRTASAETEMLTRMDQAGSRQLVITDRSSIGLLSSSTIDTINSLSTVERAVGLSGAQDIHAGSHAGGGPAAPAWTIVGDTTAAIHLTAGRAPHPGEAVISTRTMHTLGFDGPAGYLTRGALQYPVVGIYTAKEPFLTLDQGAVIAATTGTNARDLHVIAVDANAVPAAQRLALSIVAAPKPPDISVQSATNLAALHSELVADLGGFGRWLLLLVLGAGALLTGIVVLADVLLRRADLGRRRALGATRRGIIALVTLRTVIAALFGVAVALPASFAVLHQWDVTVPAEFAAGTATLTVLAAIAAAIGPAVIAAHRDPVSVLRTP